MNTSYAQGGDAKAIQRVTKAYYGSLRNMFQAHGWDVPGNKMMTSAPSLIVDVYGSIRRFEELHQPTDIMSPMEAIYSEPPNVWLTSFYGFIPEEWGLLGFTDEAVRENFVEKSKPGVLVVVYGATGAEKDERQQILGIQQCSHQLGHSKEFMSPQSWVTKTRQTDGERRWNYAVKATRAWRVTPETRLHVKDFAPQSTANEAWQHIGEYGVPLTVQEAQKILHFDLQEVEVYGENPLVGSALASAREVLAPSRAGPVSQSPYLTREAEGPKHLYILKLNGDEAAFLGESAGNRHIIKVGFSKSPRTRCADHNRAMPKGAFEWQVLFAGTLEDRDPFPTSSHAKAGEDAMKSILFEHEQGSSLGGEFFLAPHDLIEEAWKKGNQVAKEFKNER